MVDMFEYNVLTIKAKCKEGDKKDKAYIESSITATPPASTTHREDHGTTAPFIIFFVISLPSNLEP